MDPLRGRCLTDERSCVGSSHMLFEDFGRSNILFVSSSLCPLPCLSERLRVFEHRAEHALASGCGVS